MGRPRKTDKHLPKNVYCRRGVYWLVKEGKWIRLGESLPDALVQYAQAFGKSRWNFQITVDAVLGTLRLSSGTLRQYRSSAKLLKHYFEDDSLEDLKSKDIRQLKREMVDRPIAFNSSLKVLRHVFQYAIDTDLIENDPTFNIDYYPIRSRDRLITADEYAALYKSAEAALRNVMDLMFLTGQRVGDILAIKYTDIAAEGIAFQQQKTDAKVIAAWTTDLRAVVERIKSEPRHLKATTLLHTARGKQFQYHRVNTMWLRACGAVEMPYTQLRDIRAMAASAVEEVAGVEQAQALLGHTTQRTTRIYLRNRKAKVVSGPEFKRNKG
jgi:integrase